MRMMPDINLASRVMDSPLAQLHWPLPSWMSCAEHRSLNRAVVLPHRNQKSLELGMINFLKMLEDEVSAWTNVSIHDHRFGGREFRFGDAEVGHTHDGGIVDIPFPRAVRDAILANGLAEEHRWVPNSGWITFHLR